MMSSRLTLLALLTLLVVLAPASYAQTTPTSVQLTWTAPGDDGSVGTAAQYDLRYSTSTITEANFGSATRWTSMPVPAAPGSQETVTVTGLQPNTGYYFAIKTADDVSNWSPMSNLVSRTTPPATDVIRPAPIAVSITAVTDSSATLNWTAVGDDSLSGTATSYDIRYSTSTITTANWGSATKATGEPAPAAPGTVQNYTQRGLSRQVTYYFAIRAVDEASNMSALSNVPSTTTPDTMPPAAITNLSANFVWVSWRSADATRAQGDGAW